jgi:excisionase family DNA binding protein
MRWRSRGPAGQRDSREEGNNFKIFLVDRLVHLGTPSSGLVRDVTDQHRCSADFVIDAEQEAGDRFILTSSGTLDGPLLRRRDRRNPQMPLLNVDQAADRLGTSTRFIRRLIAERRISFVKLGKHVRIDSDDLDAFVEAGRVAAAVPSEPSAMGDPAIPMKRVLRRAAGRH